MLKAFKVVSHQLNELEYKVTALMCITGTQAGNAIVLVSLLILNLLLSMMQLDNYSE